LPKQAGPKGLVESRLEVEDREGGDSMSNQMSNGEAER